MQQFLLFASGAQAGSDPLATLGIDWTALLIQMGAFLVFLAVVAKFVYPPIVAMLDKREKMIRDSLEAAKEAEQRSHEAQAEVDELLKRARSEASEIVSLAKDEAADIARQAEEKSRSQADRILKEAKDSINKEVSSAKKALHNEMIDLVAAATTKVTSGSVTESIDKKIIESTLAKDGK